MVNEIVLHVGLHKTGTSSIQMTFFSGENDKLLREKGYLYPQCWSANHSIPVYSAFCDHPEQYHMNVRFGYTIEQVKELNKKYLDDLHLELSGNYHKLIVSGEDITMLTLDNLTRLKEYLRSISNKIRVVIYVRNPETWAVSVIQEKIKGGFTYVQSFQESLGIVRANFQHHVGKFIEVFERNNVNVYQFEKAIEHEFGLVGHFLTDLGFNHQEISEFNMFKSNESVSMLAGSILSYLNEKVPLIVNGKLHEKRTEGDITPLLAIRGSKFSIPYNDKKKLYEISRDDVKWLKSNFGIDYSKEPQPAESIIEFTDEVISDIKTAYSRLSFPLKELLIEYLQSKGLQIEGPFINVKHP